MATAKPSKIVDRVGGPFSRFLSFQGASGVLLLVATVVALVWANVSFSTYDEVWGLSLKFQLGDFFIEETLRHWINDALMAVFFFFVGLEIKREVMAGELSSPKQAALPIAAAIGGMIIPAMAYILLVSLGQPNGREGWGIPMATDIAFSIGILTLLGNRVPVSLKVFLTAFAIVDDLGAILIIAIFYSADVAFSSLGIAACIMAGVLLLNLLNIRYVPLYFIAGGVVWFFFLHSGIHPTVAGILMAFLIPANRRLRVEDFIEKVQRNIRYLHSNFSDKERFMTSTQLAAIDQIEDASDKVQSSAQRLEHALEGPVLYVIMPLFALANAGIELTGGGFFQLLFSSVSLGIIVGLVVGKTLGITLFTWLMVVTGLAKLQGKIKWLNIIGIGLLGGIGFTMSIFIANLAFSDYALLEKAKTGILAGSAISGVLGYLVLRHSLDKGQGKPTTVEYPKPAR